MTEDAYIAREQLDRLLRIEEAAEALAENASQDRVKVKDLRNLRAVLAADPDAK